VPATFLDESGYGRTRPDRDDMDGFFIAAFRRNIGPNAADPW